MCFLCWICYGVMYTYIIYVYTPTVQINNKRYACINDLMRFYHFTSNKSILFVLSKRIKDGTIDTGSLLF